MTKLIRRWRREAKLFRKDAILYQRNGKLVPKENGELVPGIRGTLYRQKAYAAANILDSCANELEGEFND